MAFAHGHGFVHRDIKPANVMVGHFGEVFLMDWGIAKPVVGPDHALPRLDAAPAPERVTATHVGALVGTPFYMSPEQARGEKVDARSDVYSLCVMFYELLTLRHYLHDCNTMDEVIHGAQHTKHPPPFQSAHPHQSPVPADLAWYVAKGVAKDPAARYQTVAEMIARLDARDEGQIPIQCHVTLTKSLTRRALRLLDRHPLAFTVTLALGTLGSIGAVVWRLM